MTGTELIANLALRGIRLEADGDRLFYFPKSAVTSALLAVLRERKAELLAALRTVATEEPEAETQADGEPEAEPVTATAFIAVETLAGFNWNGSDGYFPCRRIIHNGIEHKVDGCLGRTGWRHIWGGTYCSKCWPATDPASMAEGE
jgi:hypothetical protein